jgi:cytochrome c biogenesis protein CcmG/thiol:disulfide interchange protein DsbE
MNWKRATLAGAVGVPVIALLAFGLTRDPKDIPSPLPGKDAPAFALEVFAAGKTPLARAIGDTIRLETLRGEVLVLNFWASWCLACRDEHEVLSDVALQYAGTRAHFLGVLYNDVTSNGVAWIEQMGGQAYPSVNDPRARTAIAYGLYGVPETFFVGPDGRIAYKHVGPVTTAVLRHKVDSLLALPTAGGGL